MNKVRGLHVVAHPHTTRRFLRGKEGGAKEGGIRIQLLKGRKDRGVKVDESEGPETPSAFSFGILLLVAMPGAPSSFLFYSFRMPKKRSPKKNSLSAVESRRRVT